MSKTPTEIAIESAGGPKALSRILGVSSQAISQWSKVPAGRVLAVESASGVPRHELRPDLYPPPEPSDAPVPVVEAAE